MRALLQRTPAPFSVAVAAVWALLTASQLGWFPFLRYWWAVNLWSYFHPSVGLVLAIASLTLVSSNVRDALAGAGRRIAMRLAGMRAGSLILGSALALALWLVRDPTLSPDGKIFVAVIGAGGDFVFPDTGATWILFGLCRIAWDLGIPPRSPVYVVAALSGGLTAALLVKIARHRLLGDGRGAILALGLVFSGGLAHVFAGRLESYALVLASLATYVFLALRHLENGRGWYATCVALGIAVWLHAASLCFLPSLLLLPRLVRDDIDKGAWARMSARALIVAAIPGLAWIVGFGLSGGGDEIATLVTKAIEILGQSEAQDARRWWVRGWGGAPSIGTDYVFLSPAQLKHLANSAIILCPAALVSLPILVVLNVRRILVDSRMLFLAALAVPLVAYAFALRAFWGPFDWDLFATTALALTLPASYMLEKTVPRHSFDRIAVCLIVFQLCFVGAPFLAVRAGSVRDAGPLYVEGYFDNSIVEPATRPPEGLEPWL